MKVLCINNSGKALREFEEKTLRYNELGRFGTTESTLFDELVIGKDYLVMGMIQFNSHLSYLIDDGVVSACPCQLFTVLDNRLNTNWFFRLINKSEDIYPYIQAIWGYYDFVFDEKSYEKLIVDRDDKALRLYFQRKEELENENL